MTATSQTIRTPDHRVRVFVSSTLQELAPERKLVRDAIQRVHLTPVMFEMGARAHPPRDLYRAYLAQSDVFIGLYWKRYGWVAPDMSISGLEDEYVLADRHPKLIYVKTADEREPGLKALLAKIQGDDNVSYRPFSSLEELPDLIANDLMAMLSETFTARSPSSPRVDVPAPDRPSDAPPPWAPPAERNALIGRAVEVARIEAAITSAEPGFVTLTGPGGTGKTRLGIRVAHTLKDRFPDGAYYVPLASVRDAKRVVPAVVQALEIPMPQGGGDPLRVLIGSLRRQRALLVLDNFEQVIDAAQEVGEIAAACPELRIVVTSQHALRVGGEREVAIPTMDVDAEGDALSAAEALFERRAREVVPGFSVNNDNRAAVRTICRRLDGLPLALELAASRVRVLAPHAMVTKLDGALTVLSSTAKDLPERQRTLRAALSWSHDLLAEPERVLFRRLGVLTGRFNPDAALAVAGEIEGLDALDGLANLLDKSLLVRTEALGEPRFHMLETVREYARERCVEAGEEAAARLRFAQWAVRFAEQILPDVTRSSRLHVEQFALEDAGIRAAMMWCFGAAGERELGWTLFFAYGCVAQMQMRPSEVLSLHAEFAKGGLATNDVARHRAAAVAAWASGATGDYSAVGRMEGALPVLKQHGPQGVYAWCSAVLGMGEMFTGSPESGTARLTEASAVFERERDDFGAAFAAGLLALGDMMGGHADAARVRLTAIVKRCELTGCDEGASISLSALARGALMEGDVAGARKLFADAAVFSRDRRTVWGRADALMGLSAVLLALDEKTEAEAVLEETLLVNERAGTGGENRLLFGFLLGPLAHLVALRGDRARAAQIFAGVPDGLEDTDDPTIQYTDSLGSMRAGLRAARALVGEDAMALRARGVGLEESIRAAVAAGRREGA